MSGVNQIPDQAWEETTWEGSRRAQLRRALKLTLRERLQAVEDMEDVARRLQEMRSRRGGPDRKKETVG